MQTVMWTFRTKRFKVEWSIEPDYDCDLSWDETGETREKLNSGEYECFTSKMAVYLDGREIAADYLGGSIYANPSEFRDHIGMKARGHGSYFSDMVREAITEARREIKRWSETAPYIRQAA
jgi:hypothetical protein